MEENRPKKIKNSMPSLHHHWGMTKKLLSNLFSRNAVITFGDRARPRKVIGKKTRGGVTLIQGGFLQEWEN
jgi:hypothetical protein